VSDKPFFKSEAEFISWLKRRTTPRAPGLRPARRLTDQGTGDEWGFSPQAGLHLGIGDDAALLGVAPGQELILTTDLSIEGVHFTPNLHPPQAVGHRALARSLSDIAAMGGIPRYALISLAVSKHTSRTWMEGFFQGLLALAQRFRMALIGGDTAVGQGPSAIDVIVAGEVPCGKALRRSGARPGDGIFVSGCLGLAALGLRLLLRGRTACPERREEVGERVVRCHESGAHRRKCAEAAALRAHLFPQPQCALGRFLSEQGLATALIDLSDGLSLDLKRLCDASKVGARVFAEQIPAPRLEEPQSLPRAARAGGTAGPFAPLRAGSALLVAGAADSLALALDGGEDYQLLFTVPPAKRSQVPSRFGKIPLQCIGEIQAARRLRLVTSDGKTLPLEPHGYDHFAR
jgi:thiamine-monophosphate kinase